MRQRWGCRAGVPVWRCWAHTHLQMPVAGVEEWPIKTGWRKQGDARSSERATTSASQDEKGPRRESVSSRPADSSSCSVLHSMIVRGSASPVKYRPKSRRREAKQNSAQRLSVELELPPQATTVSACHVSIPPGVVFNHIALGGDILLCQYLQSCSGLFSGHTVGLHARTTA